MNFGVLFNAYFVTQQDLLTLLEAEMALVPESPPTLPLPFG